MTKWFSAIYLVSQAKTGLSALALKRQAGVSYPTAWLMHQKIMVAWSLGRPYTVSAAPFNLTTPTWAVSVLAASPGRGSQNKVPIVAAVSLNAEGNPIYAKISVVSGFSKVAIAQWAMSHLTKDAEVISDGLACFAAVTEAGCSHHAQVVGELKPRDLPQFKWVNTVLGNLKTMLSGADKGLSFWKYAQHYLGAFTYRFNRRFDLAGMVPRLLVDVCRFTPLPL